MVFQKVGAFSYKLYFLAEQWQQPNPSILWLAAFDMNTSDFDWVSTVDRFIKEFVAGNENFIYLNYTSSSSDKIGMIDLHDKSFKILFEHKPEHGDGFQWEYSQEYLVWNNPTTKKCEPLHTSISLAIGSLLSMENWGKTPDKVQFNLDGASEPISSESERPSSLFAVELSTGRVKTLSFYPAHKDDGLLLPMQVYCSMVYCCQLEEWQKEVGKGTGYKFDLTQNQPQPVKFTF